MALPALLPFIVKGAVEGLSWAGGAYAIEKYIAPYFTSDTEEIALGDLSDDDIILNTNLLEDLVKTNKALLQYHEVREDIYTPLNIDST